jgi:hypothetical protein
MWERWWRSLPADPAFLGWLTTAAYLATAVLCAAAALRACGPLLGERFSPSRLFWWVTAFLLLLLGVNKQMDLQTLFTWVLRRMARAQGWYELRRPLQKCFVAALALAGAGFYGILLFLLRRRWKRYLLALAGFALLGCYVLLRVGTFYHVQRAASEEGAAPWLKWALELGGILCIGISAALQTRRSQPAPLPH